MIDFLKQFTNLRQFFTLKPLPIDATTFQLLAGLFGLFLILGIVFIILAKQKKQDHLLNKAYNNFSYLFITMGLIGLLYSWLAFENAVVLSARFIFAIIIVVFLVWLAIILRYRFLKIPKIKKQIQSKKEFEKYLP